VGNGEGAGAQNRQAGKIPHRFGARDSGDAEVGTASIRTRIRSVPQAAPREAFVNPGAGDLLRRG
jgi:hypothetical protein